MDSNFAEVLEAARALSRSERAEVAHELIATLEATHEDDEARYAELQAAVNVGLEELDRGEGIRIPANELSEYLDQLSREATECVAQKST